MLLPPKQLADPFLSTTHETSSVPDLLPPSVRGMSTSASTSSPSSEACVVVTDARLSRRAAVITGVVVVLCLIAAASDRRATEDPARRAGELLLQSKDAYTQATTQTDPVSKVRALSRAAAHLSDARQLSSDSALERTCSVHVYALSRKIEEGIRTAMQDCHRTCGTPSSSSSQARREDDISVAARTATYSGGTRSSSMTVPQHTRLRDTRAEKQQYDRGSSSPSSSLSYRPGSRPKR